MNIELINNFSILVDEPLTLFTDVIFESLNIRIFNLYSHIVVFDLLQHFVMKSMSFMFMRCAPLPRFVFWCGFIDWCVGVFVHAPVSSCNVNALSIQVMSSNIELEIVTLALCLNNVVENIHNFFL